MPLGFVRSVAVWSRREGGSPECSAIAKHHLRGASLTTRMAIDVLTRCALDGGINPRECAVLVGSNLGEIQTAVALLAMMERDGLPSPIRFKNSVHNASVGLYGVALSSGCFSTALSAGEDLVAMALIEALAWLGAEGRPIAVALSEEEIPVPLERLEGSYEALAVGMLLTPEGREGDLAVTDIQRERGSVSVVVEGFEGNAVAPALAIVSAMKTKQEVSVALGAGWVATLSPWRP